MTELIYWTNNAYAVNYCNGISILVAYFTTEVKTTIKFFFKSLLLLKYKQSIQFFSKTTDKRNACTTLTCYWKNTSQNIFRNIHVPVFHVNSKSAKELIRRSLWLLQIFSIQNKVYLITEPHAHWKWWNIITIQNPFSKCKISIQVMNSQIPSNLHIQFAKDFFGITTSFISGSDNTFRFRKQMPSIGAANRPHHLLTMYLEAYSLIFNWNTSHLNKR